MSVLIQLDAPMMSFGHVAVDAARDTLPFPTLSMMTGLIGNALGYDHREAHKLSALQGRMHMAARIAAKRPGRSRIEDFHTADLGQDFMRYENVAWTTAGRIEERKGGAAKHGTHIRVRRYVTGGSPSGRDHHIDGRVPPIVVALSLSEGDGPTEAEVAHALDFPERPLFIGRKCCLPSCRLFLETVDATPAQAAADLPHRELPTLWIDWSDAIPSGWSPTSQTLLLRDRRDWTNQIHVGSRTVIECKKDA